MLPTALPGILTGVMLAVARAAGETAPLLFTALFSNYWLTAGNARLMEPTASLAVLIYNFSGSPFDNQIEMAWAASLVLVVLVLMANIAGQALAPAGTGNAIRRLHMSIDRRPTQPATATTPPTATATSVIDCKIEDAVLRQLQGRARHAHPDQEEHRSRPSSARPAAARARCCAASTA